MKSANTYALQTPKSGIAVPANDAIPTDLLIGGQWINAKSGKTFDVFDPAQVYGKNGDTPQT